MPPDHSEGGAIGQDGEAGACTPLVNDGGLRRVLEPHGCDVHQGERHALPQLRDAVGYHAQRDDGPALALREGDLSHRCPLLATGGFGLCEVISLRNESITGRVLTTPELG